MISFLYNYLKSPFNGSHPPAGHPVFEPVPLWPGELVSGLEEMWHVIKILLIDDDEDEYIFLKDMLSSQLYPGSEGYDLHWSATIPEAQELCGYCQFDLYLVDYYLGSETGLDLIRAVERQGRQAPFIILTGQSTYEIDLAAMQQGVADYLLKDKLNEHQLERSIRYALERHEAKVELERRVMERTRELAEKNRELENEIERRAAAENALQQAKEELKLRVVERTGDLNAANLRLETVLETLPISLAIADQDGKILNYNKAYLRLWEPVDQMGPETIDDLYHFQAWDADTGKPMQVNDWPLAQAIRQGQANSNRMIDIVTGSGVARTILYSAVPIYGPEGQILGGVGVAQDITQQRRLEQQATASAQQASLWAEALEGLHKATSALLSTLEMDDLLGQILDAAQGAIPAARKSMLHLLTPGTGELKVRATRGYSDPRILNLRQVGDHSFSAMILRDRHPTLVADIQTHSLYEAFQDELREVRSMVLAPLIYGSETLGIISLASPEVDAFNQNDLRLLASFAATTTAALQNAMLHAEIKNLAISDPLTGQLNRRAFFERGQLMIERALYTKHPLAAVMIDLDRFKDINDQYGHSTGDQVLRIMAARIRRTVRDSDLFGRYGGDEFSLLLPDTDLSAAVQSARRVCEEITHTPFLTGSGKLTLSVSAGVAGAKERHRHLEDLLADADQALYAAKAGGRNRVEVNVL